MPCFPKKMLSQGSSDSHARAGNFLTQ
jgi:hypothetical protein